MIKLKDILKEEGPGLDVSPFYDFNKTSLKAGQELFDHIFTHEGFVEYTYDDGYFPPKKYVAGTPVKRKLTIGYGTTNPKYAFPGNTITEPEARKLAATDINAAADCVRRWQSRAKPTDANKRKLTINMYRSLIDFVYNVGCSAAVNGGVFSAVEAGDYQKAHDLLKTGNWGHDKRRVANAKLFAKDGILEMPKKFG